MAAAKIRRALLPLALAFAALTAAAPAAVTRDAREVPLVDQLGRTFTLRDLGRPAALVFVDTRCTDTCPIAEALFARLAASLARAHVDARLVTVTLSPQTDTPFVMAQAARRFSADPSRWRWASGRASDVDVMLGAFNVTRVDADIHSTYCYLLDRHGRRIRTLLLSTSVDQQLFALLRDGATRS